MAKNSPDDRQARLAKMQASQRNEERRKSALIIGAASAVAVALIAVVTVVIVQAEQERSAVEAIAAEPIDGEQEFADLSRNHVQSQVDYEQTPPVGGDHLAVWQNCGFYENPIQSEAGVHSLEHGAVWLAYDPTLPTEELDSLRALADANNYLLVSPFEGLPSPVVASAWGVQVVLDGVDDERLPAFITRYQQGPQTPEPGAVCSGGLDG